MASVECFHVKPRARTNGTRLVTPEPGAPNVADFFSPRCFLSSGRQNFTDSITLDIQRRGAHTTGTRLESNALDAHRRRGVAVFTITCKTGTLRQALQNSNDASCSSRADVYQYFSPPSPAWFRATMNASRQRLTPSADNDGIVARMEINCKL